jgi:hypothetical protein
LRESKQEFLDRKARHSLVPAPGILVERNHGNPLNWSGDEIANLVFCESSFCIQISCVRRLPVGPSKVFDKPFTQGDNMNPMKTGIVAIVGMLLMNSQAFSDSKPSNPLRYAKIRYSLQKVTTSVVNGNGETQPSATVCESEISIPVVDETLSNDITWPSVTCKADSVQGPVEITMYFWLYLFDQESAFGAHPMERVKNFDIDLDVAQYNSSSKVPNFLPGVEARGTYRDTGTPSGIVMLNDTELQTSNGVISATDQYILTAEFIDSSR